MKTETDMAYTNKEHKTTEALLMIQMVEECLSSGVANQFSAEALAGLSASLKRVRYLLNSGSELIELKNFASVPQEVNFEPQESLMAGGLEVEVFSSSSLPNVRRSIKKEYSSNKPARELKVREEFKPSQDFLPDQEEIIYETKPRFKGQMGNLGPKINMSRKRLRACLEN